MSLVATPTETDVLADIARERAAGLDPFGDDEFDPPVIGAKEVIEDPDEVMADTAVGRDVFILSVSPEVMQDIRDDSGAQGWFESQKALVSSIGKDAEIFKGGAGMYNGILVDEMETCVKFSDFGSGGDLPAARSLFLGSNAVVTAHGTKGMADGMSVSLDEDTDDRKHDHILFFEMIFGVDKTQFNGMDYGMITVDSAFTAAV